MIISSEFNPDDSTLVASYYDDKGKVAFVRKPIPQQDLFNWTVTGTPTEFRNWDNKFLKKAPSKWLSRFRIEELMQSRFTKEEMDLLYSEFVPKRFFLDIEVKLVNQEFPEPAKAEREINLITFVNEDNVAFTMSTMEAFDASTIIQMTAEVNEYLGKSNTAFDPFTVKYMYFKTEEEMLLRFFRDVLPKIPFLTGWNFVDFDWLYLINRGIKVLKDAKGQPLHPMTWMPCQKLIGQSKLPIHMGLLDYMEVFEKTKPYKVVENYTLDYIANLVLGVGKVKHGYATMLEAQADVFNFVKYNIIDTCLVKLIDDKLRLLNVAFAISMFARVDVSKVFSAVFITEILLCREFLERNRFMSNDKRELDEESKYEGAYVMKPVPGYYRDIMLDDFASMYPNITVQFNMSPDAYMGKKDSIDPASVPQNVIFTRNDTLFTNSFDSAARTILTKLYAGRVETKAQMKKLEETLVAEKEKATA